ncbi:(Fe-S)-binding protein [Helicobacter cholecystus]|uniref:(Fe-S)-binding protein n=1 Tax=Helicobacter cholecystus TaxID=45498 RepID=A0A3D8ITE3_9HELI|nr:(Fe-S)-binding protein [Helicobacter cholecystus]RDU68216.1 (Fe-S)-binding protein [Helicobacter cholecystus]VEJ24489.1 oxidoreductase iron-sulfur subunit [Helicobacter cholecystus]
MKAYFFGTCLGGVAYSKALISSIKLLQYFGVEVIYKKDQTCCGQPSYNSGYYDETRRVALKNLELFSKPYPIIVPSGSCAGMMMHDYHHLFEETNQEDRVREFSNRVFDLSDFLIENLGVTLKDQGDPVKVTWHSNCHALRIARCTESSKKLLRMLKNVTLIELDKEEECCGFGGTFSIKEPEVSQAMVERKVKDIMSKDVEYIISGDGGCLLNIAGALQKINAPVKPMHLYEFLAQRVGLA